jgi:hypothetical protein
MKLHPQVVSASRLERLEFMRRLRFRWQEGIDLLWFVREVAMQIGIDLHKGFGDEAERNEDFLYFSTFRIHGRACLIASEVIALLESGHASGALGRWRSLHELAVIARFLHQSGNECAQRYMEHHVISTAKQAESYQLHCDRLGYEPLDHDVLEGIRRERKCAIEKHGAAFKEDWGWAHGHVKANKPTFADIERLADFETWRQYYYWSSTAVHGGAKGMLSDVGFIGQGDDQTPFMPSGPSNSGLEDPAICTAISLHSCTQTFSLQRPTPQGAANVEAMGMVVRTMEGAFLKAQRKLNEDEAHMQSGPE